MAMKTLGAILMLAGIFLLGILVLYGAPTNNLLLNTLERDFGPWIGMTLSVVGAVLLIGGSLSGGQAENLRAINSLVVELRNIEGKLEHIRIVAKHSVQEFSPKDYVTQYNGYDIYYKNRYYYIRDVNAKFFTQKGAESWIDTTEKERRRPKVL